MNTIVRAFGSNDAIAIPSAWSTWTYGGVEYRRVAFPTAPDGYAIIATIGGRRFTWSDDGSRWGWWPLDGAHALLSTSPSVDQLLAKS